MMFTKFSTAILFFSLLIFAACGETTETESNTAETNSAKKSQVPTVTPDGKQTPGIPDPETIGKTPVPKGATPTPGIPDPATIGKTPQPKNTPPIPGIPSEEELKKQRERKIDANVVNQKPQDAPQSNSQKLSPIDRKRTVQPPKSN